MLLLLRPPSSNISTGARQIKSTTSPVHDTTHTYRPKHAHTSRQIHTRTSPNNDAIAATLASYSSICIPRACSNLRCRGHPDSHVLSCSATPSPSKDEIRELIPYAYHGFDNDGRPIYMEKVQIERNTHHLDMHEQHFASICSAASLLLPARPVLSLCGVVSL